MSSPFSIVSHDFPSLFFFVFRILLFTPGAKIYFVDEIPFQYVLNKIHRSRAIRKSPWFSISARRLSFVFPFVTLLPLTSFTISVTLVLCTGESCLLIVLFR